MSGPKLSAFELEQRRKQELERIRREIADANSKSMRCIHEAQGILKTVELERGRLMQHKQMLENTTLDVGKKKKINEEIKRRLDLLDVLQRACSLVPAAIGYSERPEAARAEYDAIRKKLDKCRHENAELDRTRGAYEASLAPLAQNLCDAVRVKGFSLEEALSDLPPRVVTAVLVQEEQPDLSAEKAELIATAQGIIENPNASEAFRDRARQAIVRINYAQDKRELHSVRSLVLGEMQRKLRQMELPLEDYHKLLSRKNALAVTCGKGIELPGSFDDVESLKAAIQALEREIDTMEQEVLQEAEQREIAKAIDSAMEELGYSLLGAKIGSKGSRMKVFRFDEQAGLEVKQNNAGQIRIRVVGMTNGDKIPNEQEEELLLQEQYEFCKKYDEILEELRAKGVRMSKEGKRMEPDKQHSAYVNMASYHATESNSSTVSAPPVNKESEDQNNQKRKPEERNNQIRKNEKKKHRSIENG